MSGSDQLGKRSRLVVITSDGIEHRYVANRLEAAVGLDAVIVDRGKPQTRRERWQYLLAKYTFGQLVSRVGLRAAGLVMRDAHHREEALLRVLGDLGTSFARPEGVMYVDGINTPEARAMVERLAPDFLLIFGTGIVGARVLAMAKCRAFNLHTGMSPEYRGSDCAFWPVYNQQLELVGATVHECTADVDGGSIYARAMARLQPADDQFAVFARCVELGAELYVDTVRRALTGTLTGAPQDLSIGREYRAADKRLRHDIVVRWRFARGQVRDHVRALQGKT